jgi:hypothetical protein
MKRAGIGIVVLFTPAFDFAEPDLQYAGWLLVGRDNFLFRLFLTFVVAII